MVCVWAVTAVRNEPARQERDEWVVRAPTLSLSLSHSLTCSTRAVAIPELI